MLSKLTFSDRQSGIYQILNLINSKFYIGSAIDFYERYHSHLHYLTNGNHHNEHLQRAYLKYGAEAFEFQILEICDKGQLKEHEQWWLDWTKATANGYNIRLDATSNVGMKFSDEHRAKMSAWQIGRVLTAKHKTKISNTLKGRIIADEVRIRMGMGHRKIDKWPCPKGWRCKCNDCKQKWSDYHAERRKRK